MTATQVHFQTLELAECPPNCASPQDNPCDHREQIVGTKKFVSCRCAQDATPVTQGPCHATLSLKLVSENPDVWEPVALVCFGECPVVEGDPPQKCDPETTTGNWRRCKCLP